MVFSLEIACDTIIKFIQSVPYQFLNILASSAIHATKPSGRQKLNVSKVLSINKRKGITHGGAKTNMDVGSWQKMPSLGSRVLLVVNFYREATITWKTRWQLSANFWTKCLRLANQFLCALHNSSFGERGIMTKIRFMQQSRASQDFYPQPKNKVFIRKKPLETRGFLYNEL